MCVNCAPSTYRRISWKELSFKLKLCDWDLSGCRWIIVLECFTEAENKNSKWSVLEKNCLTWHELVCWSPNLVWLGRQQSQAVFKCFLRCKVKCLFSFWSSIGLRPALLFNSKKCIHVFLQSAMTFRKVFFVLLWLFCTEVPLNIQLERDGRCLQCTSQIV